MSMARPLYVHPDLRGKGIGAHFYYNPEKNTIGFSNGMGNEKPAFFIQVSEHSHRAFLGEQLELITNFLHKQFDSQSLGDKHRLYFIDEGVEVKLDMAFGKKPETILATLKQCENEIRQSLERSYWLTNQAKSVLIPDWLEGRYPGKLSFWDIGENSEIVVQKLVLAAADEGFEIDEEDMRLAIFAHIDELLTEGRQLSTEQNEFWEEMRESGEVQRLDIMSPMRARPKPDKCF